MFECNVSQKTNKELEGVEKEFVSSKKRKAVSVLYSSTLGEATEGMKVGSSVVSGMLIDLLRFGYKLGIENRRCRPEMKHEKDLIEKREQSYNLPSWFPNTSKSPVDDQGNESFNTNAGSYEIRADTYQLLQSYNGDYSQLYRDFFRRNHDECIKSGHKIGNLRMDRWTPPWLYNIKEFVVNHGRTTVVLNQPGKLKNMKNYRSRQGSALAMMIIGCFYQEELLMRDILRSIIEESRENNSQFSEGKITNLITVSEKEKETFFKSKKLEKSNNQEQWNKFETSVSEDNVAGDVQELVREVHNELGLLSEEEERKVNDVFQLKIDTSEHDVILTKIGKSDVKVSSLHTLKPTRWLNDIVMNSYMILIDEWLQRHENGERIITLPSYVYVAATNKDYRIDLLKNLIDPSKRNEDNCLLAEKILIPLHVNGNHWMLCLIDVLKKTIYVYDSLGNESDHHLRRMEKWLSDESFYLSGDKNVVRVKDWETKMMQCTQQTNSYDCGVIVCQTGRLIAMNRNSYLFNSACTGRFRSRMAFELIRSNLLER